MRAAIDNAMEMQRRESHNDKQRLVSRLGAPMGQVSDGYHTFDELYEHRCSLFLALMASHPRLAWMSRKHHDGSEWAGWFIAGIKAPTGDTTYHLPESMWPLAVKTGAAVLETGMWWDGHTQSQVADRIRAWAEVMAANDIAHPRREAEGGAK